MSIPQPLEVVVDVYRRFSKVAGYGRSPLLLVVRLYWGWQFMQNGWGKLHHLSGIASFFASLNIPFPAFNAALVSGMEFVGGLLLIFGLLSRVAGLALAFDMMVAYFTAEQEALRSFFSDPGKFYAADPYTFLFASLMILIFGAGLFSLDELIDRFTRDTVTRVAAPVSLNVPVRQG